MKDAPRSDRAPASAASGRAPLERLRGMVDVQPRAYRARQQVLGRMQDVFARHGYRPVDTPVVEPTELFLRKSGGERVAQMYAFHHRDREIALRPEHTASVLRMYIDALQSEPLPLRLTYSGPVFRYEKPQAGRSRQFTEVGCELLGGAGPVADAEVVHLALAGLAAAGVEGRLVLGHIGIVLDFLDRLPLRQRARDWLLWSMERLRKGQAVDLEEELAGFVTDDRLASLFSEMGSTLGSVPPEELERWVLAVLGEVGVQVQGGTRTPEEIVAGVIAKMNRQSDADDVRRGFDFIRELVDIRGAPGVALPRLRSLIQRHGLHDEPIAQIESVLDLLAAYGHPVEDFQLDFGLGRGLHYYTGILFEIYAADRPTLQLCGGGRYDELAQMLGARRPLPACGFSYGVERVVEAAGVEGDLPTVDVLVAATSPGAAGAAIRLAEALRTEGRTVELDVRGRSAGSNRRYAERRGIGELILVDPDGSSHSQVIGTAVARTEADDD